MSLYSLSKNHQSKSIPINMDFLNITPRTFFHSISLIQRGLNRKRCPGIASFDVGNTFHNLWHLLLKIFSFKIPLPIIVSIKSYLNNTFRNSGISFLTPNSFNLLCSKIINCQHRTPTSFEF